MPCCKKACFESSCAECSYPVDPFRIDGVVRSEWRLFKVDAVRGEDSCSEPGCSEPMPSEARVTVRSQCRSRRALCVPGRDLILGESVSTFECTF